MVDAREHRDEDGTAAGADRRRFVPPWWTVLFPVAVTLGVAGWRAATADADAPAAFGAALLWPGAAVFAVVALIVWLGWVLDID
jgi:hypothetical protein